MHLRILQISIVHLQSQCSSDVFRMVVFRSNAFCPPGCPSLKALILFSPTMPSLSNITKPVTKELHVHTPTYAVSCCWSPPPRTQVALPRPVNGSTAPNAFACPAARRRAPLDRCRTPPAQHQVPAFSPPTILANADRTRWPRTQLRPSVGMVVRR